MFVRELKYFKTGNIQHCRYKGKRKTKQQNITKKIQESIHTIEMKNLENKVKKKKDNRREMKNKKVKVQQKEQKLRMPSSQKPFASQPLLTTSSSTARKNIPSLCSPSSLSILECQQKQHRSVKMYVSVYFYHRINIYVCTYVCLKS